MAMSMSMGFIVGVGWGGWRGVVTVVDGDDDDDGGSAAVEAAKGETIFFWQCSLGPRSNISRINNFQTGLRPTTDLPFDSWRFSLLAVSVAAWLVC
jgi:hypothetical protein